KVTEKTDGVELQVGANKDQMIGVSIGNMGSRELGLGGVNVSTAEDAKDAIGRLDEAVSRISAQRADLGAAQNRLEHTIASTDNTAENLQAAESRIRDVDMAKEMMNLTKLNVLQQASQSMLAQANQAPQQVLSILR
ncbi:Flagellin protein flic, partial [Candidatus Arthromitus sp. SFB-2]